MKESDRDMLISLREQMKHNNDMLEKHVQDSKEFRDKMSSEMLSQRDRILVLEQRGRPALFKLLSWLGGLFITK